MKSTNRFPGGNDDKGNNGGHNTRNAKRKRQYTGSVGSTSSVSNDTFSGLSMNDKLQCMFESIKSNSYVLHYFDKNQQKCIQDLQNVTVNTQYKLNSIEKCINTQAQQLKMLAYRSIDIESRSRRNNLIFHGITEKLRRICSDLILRFLQDELYIDPQNIVITLHCNNIVN
ncbi:hypothetical protein ACF0H5_005160 [Mactra antiquata]